MAARRAALAATAVSLLAASAAAQSQASVKLHAANGSSAVINSTDGVRYGTMEWEPNTRFSFSEDVEVDGELEVEGQVRGRAFEKEMRKIELMKQCNNIGQLSDGNECHLVASHWHNKQIKNMVSGQGYFICAIMVDDSMRCWGHYPYGINGLGNDITTMYMPFEHGLTFSDKIQSRRMYHGRTRMLPVAYTYGNMIAAVSNGNVYVGGYGGHGLGDGTTTNRYHMVRVNPAFLNNVTSVSLGGENTTPTFCAIDGVDELYCWGYNGYGQVGAGDTASVKKVPVSVLGLGPRANNHVKMVQSSRHNYCVTCTTLVKGTVWCWGYGGYGQLGYGSTSNRDSATQVQCSGCGTTYLENIEYIQVHGGQVATVFGLRYDKTLWAWGYSGHGQIGWGSTSNSNKAVQVQNAAGGALTDVRDVYPSNGDRYGPVCAVTHSNKLYCWGYNSRGGLGLGHTSQRTKATEVTGVSNVQMFENMQSYDHSYQYRPGGCSLTTEGEVWCQGYNGNGVLGVGDSSQRNSPIQVKFVGKTSQLASRCYGSSGNDCTIFAVSEDGYAIRAWGYGGHGQVGVRMGGISYNPIADDVRLY